MTNEVLGVSTYTPYEWRAQRVKKEEPNEVEAGTGLDDAPIVDRDAVVVGRARSIHWKPGVNPVHQMTFDTWRTRPSSSSGYPPLTPVVLGTRSTPAATMSFLSNPAEGDAPRRIEKVVTDFSTDGSVTVRTRVAMNHMMGVNSAVGDGPRRGGLLTGVRAREPCLMVRASSMAISAPELPAPTTSTPPSWSCDGLRYSEEWSWTIPSSSSGAKVGMLRIVVAAGGDDDVIGEQRVVATDHLETIPDLGQSVDFDPSLDREVKLAGVGLHVVGRFVLAG